MALFEKLDDLCGKATEIMQTGMDKATEMMQSGVAIAKLKTDNMAEEDAMRRAFLAIGRMYFELYGDAPDPAFSVECERIQACKRRIAENELRLAEMKKTAPQPTTPCEPITPEPVQPLAQEPIDPQPISSTPFTPPVPDVVPEEKEEIAIEEIEKNEETV